MTPEKNESREGWNVAERRRDPGPAQRTLGRLHLQERFHWRSPAHSHAPTPCSACARRANAARPVVAFPTPKFQTPIVQFHETAPLAQPVRKLPRRSALPAGSVRRRSLQTPAASGYGCRSGHCGPASADPCSQGRGALASAAWCGAAAGLPAAHLCRRGCGPEAAGGSLHFPARPRDPGVR